LDAAVIATHRSERDGRSRGLFERVVILTSDNPRTEDPNQILADAEKGIQKTGKPYKKESQTA